MLKNDDMTATWTRTLAVAATAMLLGAWPAAAQAPSAPAAPPVHGAAPAEPATDVGALAKQTQNPVSSLISVPFQSNFDFGMGDRDANATTLNIQPVLPFAISSGANVILRVIMPLQSRPGPSDTVRFSGLGDVTATAFFTPSKPHTVTLGVGPVFILPAATSAALGGEHFGIGSAVVALVQPGPWTIGALYNQIWSTSGDVNRDGFEITYLQPFVNYNLGQGLSVGYSLEATANWKAPSTNTWNAPMVFKVSKVTKLGHQHMQIEGGAGPVVASSDSAATWRFRLNVAFLFPR
jgi:hypothetical protein